MPDNPVDTGTSGVGNAPVNTGESSSWYSGLPEDIRGSASITKFKDVESLARGYINAEQLIGRDKIPMPRTDEEFMQTFRRLGAPENADGYSFNPKEFEQYGQGALDDLALFRTMAAEVGLTDNQAKALFGKYVGSMTQRLQNAEVEFETAKHNARQELMQKYGKAYDQNMQKANRALTYLASPQLIDALTNSGIANNPEFVDMMVQISKHYVEEQGIDNSMGNQMSVQQLSDEISKLTSHPAYFDGSHPEHNMIVQKVRSMYEQMTQA